jgi:membrane protein YdbS with pleckstrin-like domain
MLVKGSVLTHVTIAVLVFGVCVELGASPKVVLIGMAVIVIVCVVGLAVAEALWRRGHRREEALRTSIESRYAGMRARRIAEGKWRVENVNTGQLESVLSEDGITVLSIRGQSVAQ